MGRCGAIKGEGGVEMVLLEVVSAVSVRGGKCGKCVRL